MGSKYKLISFSLFGDSALYFDGALRNIDAWQSVYPDWKMRIYASYQIGDNWHARLEMTDAEIQVMTQTAPYDGLGWRFLPAADENVDALISRDIDAQLTLRERAAVEQWLNSEKQFHIIRDHPQHSALILAGLWGARGGALPKIGDWMRRYGRRRGFNGRRWDQQFLARWVYPTVFGSVHVNSEFFYYEGEDPHVIPMEREGDLYLGFPIDRGTLSENRKRRFRRLKDRGVAKRPLPEHVRAKVC